MSTDTVAVVMSTYNGERYLREQIDSILAQQGVSVKLFIRDDGSRDGTAAIIGEYAAAHPNVVFWNENDIKNIGIRDSFLSLLKEVSGAYPDIPYFAFADQDDFWKEDKLAAAVTLMREKDMDESRPAMYYSNKTFVDVDLQLISEEHIKYYGDFFETLWHSLVFGCTMVMNRALVQLATRAMPVHESIYHDIWLYKLAKVCGASIAFDEESHLLYRQHGNNFCGETGTKLIPASALKNLFSKSKHLIQKQFQEIVTQYDGDISPENRKYIDWVLHYDQSVAAWWHLAASPLARKRGAFLYCVWLAKLVLRKL